MTLRTTFGAVGAIREKLLAGDRCDVLILTESMIDQLTASGHVVANSGAALGHVRTGIGVRSDDPPPDISDRQALERSLRNATDIFLPDPQRATAGIHFVRVLKQLEIYDELSPRLRPHPNGATAMHAMAQSDASRPIGCTQITEIKSAEGATWWALCRVSSSSQLFIPRPYAPTRRNPSWRAISFGRYRTWVTQRAIASGVRAFERLRPESEGMNLVDKEAWARLSPRLDELLELPETERDVRLGEMAQEDPALAAELASLFAQPAQADRLAFLEGSAFAAADVTAHATLAGQTIGAYTLERPLGEGGMGAVWLGHRSDGRYEGQVAVKFLNLACSPAAEPSGSQEKAACSRA